jgi:hypothetical protein
MGGRDGRKKRKIAISALFLEKEKVHMFTYMHILCILKKGDVVEPPRHMRYIYVRQRTALALNQLDLCCPFYSIVTSTIGRDFHWPCPMRCVFLKFQGDMEDNRTHGAMIIHATAW